MRRSTFADGKRVALADGRLWTLPARPTGRNDPEYDTLIRSVFEAEDAIDRLRVELALTIFLLSRNYFLSPDSFRELLGFRPGDPAQREMQRAVHELALEQARDLPPPSSATDIEPTGASPSSPWNMLESLARLRARWLPWSI